MAVLDEAARSDIQGNILRAYGFRYGRYSILRIKDPAGARRLLSQLLDQNLIVSAATWDQDNKRTSAINVAFSHAGLAAMGVPAGTLATFPPEFIEGMPARAALLGDTGKDAPENWAFGRDPDRTHVFLTVSAKSPSAREEMLQKLLAALAAVGDALEVTHRLDVAALEHAGEHFGFEDGLGQPAIEGSGAPEYPGDGEPVPGGGWRPLKAGEFVLGYEGEGPCVTTPAAPFGLNGSFMVYRQLAQDVTAFRSFLRDQAAAVYGEAPDNVELLAAKLVGRWRSGCPISRSPERDDPAQGRDCNVNNDFRYADDEVGRKCPVGSHIRLMNPRDATITGATCTHRIVRRGVPYGPWLEEGAPDDGVERGVAFMAINASIHYQFEFLQREWGNKAEFAGLGTNDVDPLFGQRREGARFQLRRASGLPRSLELPRFVTLRGGGYFFIPSLSALRHLTDGAA
jgi:Dyp-type peroxidase family